MEIKMSKHSKLKNAGILFELLVRQITSDTLSGKTSPALKILEKYFSPKTELCKEYQLYRTLVENKFQDERKSAMLLDATVDARKKLSNEKLNSEKYQLIKSILENYDQDEFFKSRVQNYKLMASINTLFDSAAGKNVLPIDMVNSKSLVIENICGKIISTKPEESSIIEEYAKLDNDIRLLAYKILVDRFNDKYANLNNSQRRLLKEYINSASDTTTLRDFINKEIPIIKKSIEEHINKCDDDVVKIKLTEVSQQIDNYLRGRIIKETHVLTLMRYYQLIKELNIAHK